MKMVGNESGPTLEAHTEAKLVKREQVKKRVVSLLGEYFNDTVSGNYTDGNMSVVGLADDSLDAANLALRFEDEFKEVPFPRNFLFELDTLGNIVNYIASVPIDEDAKQ